MPPESDRTAVTLDHAVGMHWLRDGDLLLFRGTGLLSRSIQVAGRSEYSHAALVGWWRDTPLCLEVREWYGGRVVTLDSQVARYPGAIDLYQADPAGPRYQPPYAPEPSQFDRRRAVEAMLRLAGGSYGYLAVLQAALLHLPGFRWMQQADTRDAAQCDCPPFCSAAVAMACRAGGVDPVPQLADRMTEPGDLARSSFFKYRCTLTAVAKR